MTNIVETLLERAHNFPIEFTQQSAYPFKPPLAPYLDCALHQPEATPANIEALCSQALQYRFATVFINPIFISQVRDLLAGSGVKVGGVAGFPLGAYPTKMKVKEALYYINLGADEIDMVAAVGMLKAGQYAYVLEDIQQVAEAVHQSGGILKVILETGLLTRFEKIMGCMLSQAAGADFVKTATGFFEGGATVEDINLMRRVVGPASLMGVKASGGVRSLNDAMRMIAAGANRIGASRGAKILDEYRSVTAG